jgi:glycosyltransferase involved in cell wall biosynthesis
MSQPVDLLLITWNRREYVEKTIPNLLASASDFRLYCWDNDSKDGTADLIASIKDPRVVARHFSKENVKQREPTLWFLDVAKGDVGGKIDDDILLPDGWIERIAPLVRSEPRFGMLGCWIYMPEDWDEAVAAPKIIEVGGQRVFRNSWIAGQSFLARLDLIRGYVIPDNSYSSGFPIRQFHMTRDGYINGYPLPMMFAHNMDDPRSPDCLMNRPGGMGEHAALTARNRGFKTPEEYGEWIAADAAKMLTQSLEGQYVEWLETVKDNRIGQLRNALRVRARFREMFKGLTARSS